MEANQGLSGDEDDFYPMNDEEEPEYTDQEYAEAAQPQGNNPIPDLSANMELFKYQETLFKEVTTKNTTPKQYQLGTGSYFDYHFNRFSAKFQERIDDNDIAFNIFFSLQEFIKEFKNCNPDDTDSRLAGLTAYLAQIKEEIDKEYSRTLDKNQKAAQIREYNHIAVFLEAAMMWRIENYATEFPDIQEKDITEALNKAERDIKLQYEHLVKKGGLKDKESELEKILQNLKDLKICPLWHEKVCKRLELRKEVNRLLLKKGPENGEGAGNITPTPGEKYKGEVSDMVFGVIKKKKERIAEEKNKIIIDKIVYKVSDSFDIPSGYILEGTYFDSKLKAKVGELEALNLKHGNLEIFKALNEVIEVINLLFNTPVEQLFFNYNLNELVTLLKDYQTELKKMGGQEGNELFVEIMVFLMRFVDIMEDMIEWKGVRNTSHGDVRNEEAEKLIERIEFSAKNHEIYLIGVQRSTFYMTLQEYEANVKAVQDEINELFAVRLSAKNVNCVERFDSLLAILERIHEGFKQFENSTNKNYQALKALYEEHKINITRRVYTMESRARHMKDYEALIEDFDKRFGESIAYGIRTKYKLWPRELALMKLGGK